MMNYLVILDFSTGESDIYPVMEDDYPDIDELLTSLGHRANDCQWMFSKNIVFHNQILDEKQ